MRRFFLFGLLFLFGCSSNQPLSNGFAPGGGNQETSISQSATPTPRPTETPAPTPTPTPADAAAREGYQISMTADPEEWTKINDDEGVLTFTKKKSDDGLVALRGEYDMPVSILKVAAVFDDKDSRKDWVDSLVEGGVLRSPNRLYRVEYNHTAVPWPFQDRDFVFGVNVELKKNPSTMILRMKSIDDPLAPVKDGIVRGNLRYCYYHIQELKPDLTHVIVELSLDPEGAIPKWLVNYTQRKWPRNTLLGLSKVALRPTTQNPKDLEKFYQAANAVEKKGDGKNGTSKKRKKK